MRHQILIFINIISVLFFISCGKKAEKSREKEHQSLEIATGGNEEDLFQLSDTVVEALSKANWDRLSTLVHPQFGLGFTTEAFLDTSTNVRFNSEQIRKLGKNKNQFLWGMEDGTGEEIKLSFKDYFHQYLFDKNYTKMKRGKLNEQLGTSNTANNILSIFPKRKVTFIEYHFPGTDKASQMDWSSLRLVFKKFKDKWYLIYLVHDQWSN